MKDRKLTVLSFAAIVLLPTIACCGGGEQEVTAAVGATRVVGHHESRDTEGAERGCFGRLSTRERMPRPKNR